MTDHSATAGLTFGGRAATYRDGDEVVVEIDRVGRLVNVCREEREPLG